MIELIEKFLFEDWHTQRDIINELHKNGMNINDRSWRLEKQKWNDYFAQGIVDFGIAHSSQKGYKATRNKDELQEAINDYRSRENENSKSAFNLQCGIEMLERLGRLE